MQQRIKKETSAVGGIAPSDNQRLAAPECCNSAEDVKRQKTKRKLMNKGNNKNQPKEFKTLESREFKDQLKEMARDTIFEMLIEQDDPERIVESVMNVYDNIVHQVNLSLKYSRVFIADGMKTSDDGMKFSLKRAKDELDRVAKLSQDMNQLLKKVYQANRQEKAREEQAIEQQKKPVEREEAAPVSFSSANEASTTPTKGTDVAKTKQKKTEASITETPKQNATFKPGDQVVTKYDVSPMFSKGRNNAKVEASSLYWVISTDNTAVGVSSKRSDTKAKFYLPDEALRLKKRS
jgi:hypothetical protein